MLLCSPACTLSALRSSSTNVQKVSSRLGRLTLGFGLGMLLLNACDREAETRAEARSLLERLNTLSGEGSLVARQNALDALKKLPLREPAHVRTRDVCLGAHQQLLTAETSQLSARKALEEASRRLQPGGGALTLERGQSIALELSHSNDALAQAKKRFPACEEATQKLVLKAR